jgi:hypothetical protein
VRVLKALQGPLARKGQPARKDQLARKVLQARQDPRDHKEVPGSRGLQALKVYAGSRVLPVLLDRPGRRMRPGRQPLCVTSRGLEMRSRAMMAKCWFRPFARKVLLPFKEPPEPNVVQLPAWLVSVCGNRPP